VDELIDPVTESWDLQLLSQTFWEEDVKVIRTIPVHVEMDDVLAWHFDEKGCFSVKSAYWVHRHVLRRSQHHGRAGAAGSSEGNDKFWKQLWKIDCMPKVKHFLWRLSHNALAFRKILQRKGMKIDTRCCMCGRSDEDGGHLLFKCKAVKEVWRALNLEAIRCELAESVSAMDMMEKVFKLESKTQIMVVLLLWLWWDERNKWREEGRRRPGTEVAYIAAAMANRVIGSIRTRR
jgi:hypothetical protein